MTSIHLFDELTEDTRNHIIQAVLKQAYEAGVPVTVEWTGELQEPAVVARAEITHVGVENATFRQDADRGRPRWSVTIPYDIIEDLEVCP